MIETEEIEKAIISLNCGFDVVLYGEANAYFLALFRLLTLVQKY